MSDSRRGTNVGSNEKVAYNSIILILNFYFISSFLLVFLKKKKNHFYDCICKTTNL